MDKDEDEGDEADMSMRRRWKHDEECRRTKRKTHDRGGRRIRAKKMSMMKRWKHDEEDRRRSRKTQNEESRRIRTKKERNGNEDEMQTG